MFTLGFLLGVFFSSFYVFSMEGKNEKSQNLRLKSYAFLAACKLKITLQPLKASLLSAITVVFGALAFMHHLPICLSSRKLYSRNDGYCFECFSHAMSSNFCSKHTVSWQMILIRWTLQLFCCSSIGCQTFELNRQKLSQYHV